MATRRVKPQSDMFKSIRFRLLLWSAVVLTAAVSGFATILYYEVRSARFGEIDAQLDTAASTLEASLRLFPPNELNGELGPGGRRGGGPEFRPDGRPKGRPPGQGPDGPRMPPGGMDGDRPGPRGDRPPFFPAREMFMEQLVLPAKLESDAGASYFNIWRADGTAIKSIGTTNERSKPESKASRTLSTVGDNRELTIIGPHDSVIVVGRPVNRVSNELSALRWQLFATGIAVLAIGLVGTWLISRRIFRPVESISATASRITGDNLTERIDESKIDLELGGLARTLNGTFDRLEAAFDRQARFTADASHELRTPLAVIRSQAELALLRERSPEEYKAALESCHGSAVRMTDLVERLLALARADAGWPGLVREPVSFDRLVTDIVEQLKPLATKKELSLKARVKPARVHGDTSVLSQLITNLISNAMTYNKPGGKIRVGVDPVDGGVSFIVADTGMGISSVDRDRLFERFFRVDKARTRASGGTGLGLAICKAIVDAHGGWIDVKSTEGKGSEFRVWFPAEHRPGHRTAEGKAEGVERAVSRPHAGDVGNGPRRNES